MRDPSHNPTLHRDDDPLLRLARAPAVRWLAAAAAGILAAHASELHTARPAFAAAAVAAALALALPARLAGLRQPLALLAIAALAAAWLAYTLHHPPPHDARHVLPDREPILARITATVDEPPRLSTRQTGALAPHARFNPTVTRTTITLHTLELAGGTRPASGRLWLRINHDATHLQPGDRFTALARLRALSPPANPGQSDIRLYAHPRGIVGSASIDAPESITITRHATPRHRPLTTLQHRAQTLLDSALPADTPAATLLPALLLGDRTSPTYDDLHEPFARTGIAHLLAISGLHVAIACALLACAIRLTGDRPIAEAVAVLIAAAAFLTLIPARTPILRAAVIVIAFTLARLAGRRYDSINLLAIAAIALLIRNPADLLSPGFQLTFAITAALLLFTTPLTDTLTAPLDRPHRARPTRAALLLRAPARPAAAATAVALIAWIASAPLTAAHFHNAPLLSMPMSLITLPLITAIIALAYPALALAATPLAELAQPLTAAAIAAANTLARLVHAADNLNGSELRLPPIHPLIAIAWATLATLAARHLTANPWRRINRRLRLPPAALIAAAVTLATLTALNLHLATRLPSNAALRLHTFAVGDGNTHLLRTPTHNLLIDAGSTWLAAGQRLIPDAVRASNVRSTPTAIITHADLDHFAAIPDAARELGIRRIITTPQFLRAASDDPNALEAVFLRLIREQNITVHTVSAGDTIDLGTTTAHVLHPTAAATYPRDNEASLVLALHTPTLPTLLLTADAEGPALDAIDQHTFPNSPIITDAPHHGSPNRDAVRTISRLNPHTVIQSTGPTRVNNQPWNPLRHRTNWLTTATHGAITTTIHTDGSITTSTFLHHPDATTTPQP